MSCCGVMIRSSPSIPNLVVLLQPSRLSNGSPETAVQIVSSSCSGKPESGLGVRYVRHRTFTCRVLHHIPPIALTNIAEFVRYKRQSFPRRHLCISAKLHHSMLTRNNQVTVLSLAISLCANPSCVCIMCGSSLN